MPKKQTPPTTPSPEHHEDAHDTLISLLKENIEISKEILEHSKKTRRFMFWTVVSSYLRLAIIIVPLVLALIYLPPFLGDIWSQYQQLLGISASGSPLDVTSVIQQITPEQQELIQQFLSR